MSAPDDAPNLDAALDDVAFYRALFALMAFHQMAIFQIALIYGHPIFQEIPLPRTYSEYFGLIAVASILPPLGIALLMGNWGDKRIENVVDGLAWIMLVCKCLLPIGPVVYAVSEAMTPRVVVFAIITDLVWILPLMMFLLRRSVWQRTVVVWLSVIFHLMAGVALLFVQNGTEIGGLETKRWIFVLQHRQLWMITWLIWAVASSSFLAFAVAWTAKIWELATDPIDRWVSAAACVVALLAASCDLAGESTLIGFLPLVNSASEFLDTYRIYQWFSPAIANGLYCVVGLVLSVISWRQGWLTGIAGVTGFVVWTIGLALTVATIIESTELMFLTGALTIGLFMPWSAWVGWELRRGEGKNGRA